MSKLQVQILAIVLLTLLFSLLYLFSPQYYNSIDNRLRDFMFLFRGEIPHSEDVVIVDVDEKSLLELGQWPWSRHKIAQLLENLHDAEPKIIGLDIMFPEPDNTSPSIVLKDFQFPLPEETDYDHMLSQSIKKSETIVSYVFRFDDKVTSDRIPVPDAIVIENNTPETEFLISPNAVTLNIPSIQDSALATGYFNTIPDETGIVRNIPLVMRYQGIVYEALALVMIRKGLGLQQIDLDYGEYGLNQIRLGELTIPTDRNGQMMINYRGKAKTYQYVSAVDVFNGTFERDLVKSRYIIIGASAVGLTDIRSTPVESVYPGVEIHANIIDNILKGDILSKPTWVESVDLILILFIVAFSILSLHAMPAFRSLLFMSGLIVAILAGAYHVLFDFGIAVGILFPLVSAFLSFIVATVINYFYETRQKEFIKAKFSTKVSPQVVEDLIHNTQSGTLRREQREVTVFFSDIRGYATIAERFNDPEKTIAFLNEYMMPVVDMILEHRGTVDKFIGDNIMSYWNAPLEVKNHQDVALDSAMALMKRLRAFNELNKKLDRPSLNVGVGINTGVCIVGEIGSFGRSDYTVIGDPVNIAYRLEDLNKIYDTNVIVGEPSINGLVNKERFRMRDLDIVRVKGKTRPVRIFEVMGYAKNEDPFDDYMHVHHSAIDLYRSGEFTEAERIFKMLYKKFEERLYKVYLERCDIYKNNPNLPFDGTLDL